MNRFHELVEELDDGDLTRQLGEQVQTVVKAVRRTKLPGTISLVLSFKSDGRTMVVTPKVTTRIPAEKSNATTFYDLENGDLDRNDPKQLPLRTVGKVPLHVAPVPIKETK